MNIKKNIYSINTLQLNIDSHIIIHEVIIFFFEIRE